MSKKIIGVTVGTTLPKPNFKQTDPTKGDYIRNKPDFEGLKTKVDTVSDLVGDIAVSEQIGIAVDNLAAQSDLTAVDDRVIAIEDWHSNFVEVSEEEIEGLFV